VDVTHTMSVEVRDQEAVGVSGHQHAPAISAARKTEVGIERRAAIAASWIAIQITDEGDRVSGHSGGAAIGIHPDDLLSIAERGVNLTAWGNGDAVRVSQTACQGADNAAGVHLTDGAGVIACIA